MKVKDRMRENPVTVNEDMNVFHALEIMKETGVQSLPVLAEDGRLCGMLEKDTLYDFLRKHTFGDDPALAYRYLSHTAVKDLMTEEAVFITEEDTLLKASRLLRESGMDLLAVTGEDGKVTGVIGRGDVLLVFEEGEERR